MTVYKKVFFSALVLVFVALVIEGMARLIWWRLEARSFASRKTHGAEILNNDALNFMKVPDQEYGYRLKENFKREEVHINSQGFHQTDVVPVAKQDGYLRVACLGESTTFGSSVDVNYPAYLRTILTGN